jgi:hypothetical protein
MATEHAADMLGPPDDFEALKSEYLSNGFCYLRSTVSEVDIEALTADIWKQAEVKISSNWNGSTRTFR